MLILDEATSSIDTRTELQVQEAFDNLMKVQVFALFSEAENKSGYDSHHEEVVGKRYVS